MPSRSAKPKQLAALTRVSVATTTEADEAVAGLLAEIFGQPATSYTHFDSGRTHASVYLGRSAEWSRPKREQIVVGLKGLRDAGVPIGAGRISVTKVRREDWAESWKKHFRPFVIGKSLLIKPSWSSRRPGRSQAVVVLDPGLSFGTGQHPTTRFCLEELVASRQNEARQTFLDIGLGSGILSIAAVKLGFSDVTGFDNDPEAIRVAQVNARMNRIHRMVNFFLRDLGDRRGGVGAPCDVVCANLTYDLLLQHRERILAQVERGGCLVLAGILKSQFPLVARAYQAAGLVLERRERAGDWESGRFRMPS
ncbi:MAG TPA: 50S ribosomal protein L11 methyltransferase [Verrucomicrobiae bacterium]|nr:50S ribosomal protein L11 methyltransferase [Verrucomicrobiae bacterium]